MPIAAQPPRCSSCGARASAELAWCPQCLVPLGEQASRHVPAAAAPPPSPAAGTSAPPSVDRPDPEAEIIAQLSAHERARGAQLSPATSWLIGVAARGTAPRVGLAVLVGLGLLVLLLTVPLLVGALT